MENLESSEIMEKVVVLHEETVAHIIPYCNDEVERTLETEVNGWSLQLFLSYLEEELKEIIKSLLQAGNYNNNLFDLKKYLEHFH